MCDRSILGYVHVSHVRMWEYVRVCRQVWLACVINVQPCNFLSLRYTHTQCTVVENSACDTRLMLRLKTSYTPPPFPFFFCFHKHTSVVGGLLVIVVLSWALVLHKSSTLQYACVINRLQAETQGCHFVSQNPHTAGKCAVIRREFPKCYTSLKFPC